MDYKKLYYENEDFKKFVNKDMDMYGLSLEESLSHKLVQIVGEEYANGVKQSKKDIGGLSSENGIIAMS